MYTLNTVSERLRLNNRGSINFRVIFWILFLAAAGYAGYMIAPPYAVYYMFKTEVEAEAKTAHMYSNEKMLDRLMAKVEYWKVPIERDDIKISRIDNEVFITVHYEVTLNLPGGNSRTLYYDINVTKPLMESTGALH